MELALIDQVEKLAARENRSKLLVIETAVASFFSPDSADRREAAIVRRLDFLNHQFERIDRHLIILAEYIHHTIRLWIRTELPTLTAPDKAARAKSFELQATLLHYVAQSLARGRSAVQEISEDIDAQRSDVADDTSDASKH
jgi:hypothetical protein